MDLLAVSLLTVGDGDGHRAIVGGVVEIVEVEIVAVELYLTALEGKLVGESF